MIQIKSRFLRTTLRFVRTWSINNKVPVGVVAVAVAVVAKAVMCRRWIVPSNAMRRTMG